MVMKRSRHITVAVVVLLLAAMAAGCSNRGVHMPKRRKPRHCDCPTFSLQQTDTVHYAYSC